jgi:hypothetical protein
MGWLSNYRKMWQERRRKRQEAQAEARQSLHDDPSVTRSADTRGKLGDPGPPGI